jgi:hypothetical protein
MKTPQPDSVRVLRWVFRRNDAAITCEIDSAGDHAFDVCVIPHWNVSASTIERFDVVHRAFERHAELARRLRDAGWMRTPETTHRPTVAAAA